jgi:hypothetical protein
MKNKRLQLKNGALYVLTGLAAVALLYAMNLKYPGQVIVPLLKAVLLTGIVFIYGFFLMSLFKRDGEDIDVPSAFAVGLMFTTFFFFLAGFLQLLAPAVMLLYYLLPLLLLGILIKRQKTGLSRTVQTFFQRSPLAYPVFFLPFIFACLPSSFYDTLVYHLGIPNLYLQHGGFIATPQFLFANTSIYYEVSLIPAVYAGDLAPRLFHFLIGVILLLAAADFAKETFNLKKRGFFILLVVSMPMSVFLLSTVKNDLTGALFILLGMRYMLKNRFPLAALFWGFSIGIKYFNVLPLVIFLIVYLVKEKKFPLKKLVLMGVIITAVVTPLLVKNYVYAGNPFFPFLGDYFKGEYWDASRFGLMQSDVGKMFHSLTDMARFPYTVSFHHAGFGGMVGVQFLAFLPFLLLFKERLKKKWYLLVFALLTIYAGGLFTGSVRFLYITFVVLTFYLAAVYEEVTQKGVRFLFYIVIGFNLVTALALQEHMYRSFQLLAGTVDSETYKAAVFPTYPAIAFINKNIAGQNKEKRSRPKVLLVGEARNYYLKQPYINASGVDYSILKKYLNRSRTIKEFLRVLQKDDIGFIIFNAGEFNRLQKGYTRLNEGELRQMTLYFQQMHSYIVFKQKNLLVFSLTADGAGQ